MNLENLSEDNELVCECEISNAHDTHVMGMRKDIDGEPLCHVLPFIFQSKVFELLLV